MTSSFRLHGAIRMVRIDPLVGDGDLAPGGASPYCESPGRKDGGRVRGAG